LRDATVAPKDKIFFYHRDLTLLGYFLLKLVALKHVNIPIPGRYDGADYTWTKAWAT
jgi:hypothetical protein